MADPKKEAPKDAPRKHLRVRATREGFYSSNRIRVGTTFTLVRDADFSAKWMEDVDPSTPDAFAARHAPRRQQPGQPTRRPNTLNGMQAMTVTKSRDLTEAPAAAAPTDNPAKAGDVL
jgi:hypothetical protein